MTSRPVDSAIRIAKNEKEIESFRSAWEQFQNHPNSDLDHFLLVCRIRKNVLCPFVIAVGDPNRPRAILAGRLEKSQVAPSFGYWTPISVPVTKLSVLHKGWLGETTDEIGRIFLLALRSLLTSGEADVVELYNLPEGSALLRSAEEGVSRVWRDPNPEWSTHWQMTLPSEQGALLQKMRSKHRSWIRRKARELEEAHPSGIRYETFDSGADLDQLCSKLETIARKTYQRGLDAGFKNDPEHRERFALFHRRNALRAYILYIKEVPCAYCVGTIYGNTFYFSTTGYDPAMREFEIGTLLFLYMVDQLIRERVEIFNFGFGDAYYKKRFGDSACSEGTIRLYAKSTRGIGARVSTGVLKTADSLARRAASKLGALNAMKQAWRRKLTKALPENESDK